MTQDKWGIWSDEQQMWMVLPPGRVFVTDCRGYAEAQCLAMGFSWYPDRRVREFDEWYTCEEKGKAAFEHLEQALVDNVEYCKTNGLELAGEAFEEALKYLRMDRFSSDKESTGK